MIGLTIKEFTEELCFGGDIEFTYKQKQFLLTCGKDNELWVVDIWSIDKLQTNIMHYESAIQHEYLDYILNTPLFDGKSIMQLGDEISVQYS